MPNAVIFICRINQAKPRPIKVPNILCTVLVQICFYQLPHVEVGDDTYLELASIILEAKKFLHLTYKSIKEIAYELCFEDQHYLAVILKTK